MMKNRTCQRLIVLALAWASPALAVNLGDTLVLQGFGTVGGVHSSNRNADYVANYYFQSRGAGRDNPTALSIDTKLGLQLTWTPLPDFSMVSQLMVKQNERNDWTPQLEWAFLKYRISPELEVRAGRIRPPVYMLSSFLDVNISNPWVRPPVEFYSSAPLSRMEGVDLLWRTNVAGMNWRVQPYAGRTSVRLPGRSLDVERIFGASITGERGNLSMRFGHLGSRLTLDDPNLKTLVMPLLQSYCRLAGPASPECSQLQALALDDKRSSFTSLGLAWDDGTLLLQGEVGKRRSDSFVADATVWYVSAAYRIGAWTPYLMHSRYKVDSPKSFSAGSIPDNAAFPGAPGSNRLISGLLANNPMDQHTTTLGVRYDIRSDLALKMQFDDVRTRAAGGIPGSGAGLFVNRAAGFADGSNRARVFSVSLDFTF